MNIYAQAGHTVTCNRVSKQVGAFRVHSSFDTSHRHPSRNLGTTREGNRKEGGSKQIAHLSAYAATVVRYNLR